MAQVKFELGTDSVTFSRNPSKKTYEKSVYFFQPEGLSTGGEKYVYDKGLSARYDHHLQWQRMPLTDLQNLIWFFRDVAKGKLNTFTYYDHEGNPHTVRFKHERLSYREVSYQRFYVELVLEE